MTTLTWHLFFQVNVKGTEKKITTWHETLAFLKQGFLFWDFGDRRYSSWTVDGTVHPKTATRSPCCGWRWFKGLSERFAFADFRARFFLASWLHPGRLTWNLKITELKRKIIFQTIIFRFHVNLRGCKQPFLQYTPSTTQVIKEIGLRFLSPISYIHEFFVVTIVTITHGHEATGATTMLERWVGSDHFELVVWLQSHHYKYKPLRKGIQGSKTLDLFVLLSKNARKNYQRFCLKEKSW